MEPRKPYPSDIGREQFELIRFLLEGVRKRTKPRTVDLYEFFNAVHNQLKSGCQWRMLPDAYFWAGVTKRAMRSIKITLKRAYFIRRHVMLVRWLAAQCWAISTLMAMAFRGTLLRQLSFIVKVVPVGIWTDVPDLGMFTGRDRKPA